MTQKQRIHVANSLERTMNNIISISEAAKRAGCHKSYILSLCQAGRVEGAYQFFDRWYVPVGAVISPGNDKRGRKMKITKIV